MFFTFDKINYMDPRISVAWCKRNEVPIEKIFSKTLTGKFNWAMAVPPDWEFNGDVGRQGQTMAKSQIGGQICHQHV